jgi:hypothetical protein
MRAPPEVLPPAAIVAAKNFLISQSYWKPLELLIDKLAKEPIWKQLNKRHPVISHSQLAAWSKIWAWEGVNGSDRDIATQMVFLHSVKLCNAEPETSTVNYKKIADRYRAQAERLRIEAKELEEACIRNRGVSFSPAASDSVRAQAVRLIGLRRQAEEYVRTIERAAALCEAEANWAMITANDPSHDPGNTLVVCRHRKKGAPPYLRGYCILLAEFTRSLYGDALYGILEKVATVALNQKVTKASIRHWCEDKSA